MKLIARRVTCIFSICGALGGICQAQEHTDLPPTHSVEPELYATGFEYAEGPAVDPAGDLFVANYRVRGTIGRITPPPDAGAGVFCDLREAEPLEGRQSRANGLKVDSERRLIVADIGVGRVLRISADGKNVEVLADRCGGKRFNSIDDVALDRDGNIYFSDPGGSSVKNPVGSVYRYAIKTTKVTQLVGDLAFPKGLAVTPDGKHFCVAEGQRYRVLMFDLTPEGKLAGRRVLIDFPTETRGQIIGGAIEPDGMIFDAAGRLYVAMDNGGVINVVEVPSGKLIRQYTAGGEGATNCHFHDGYLYVTVAAKEAVFRLKLGVSGYDYAGTAKGK
jgi:sugar lactone lactonase YvrE